MPKPTPLSEREQEVVRLLLEGKSNKLIAFALGISESTVEFHLKRIFAKQRVNSRVELILKLRESTVAEEGELAENRGKSGKRGWATSLREAASIIGKELRMDSNLSSSNEVDPTTFFGSIRTCFNKYADFSGRATRAEFWWFVVFMTLVTVALAYISQDLANIFSIAVLLPFLAVGSRRLQDAGKSAWNELYLLVPVGGIIVLSVYWAMPTEETA